MVALDYFRRLGHDNHRRLSKLYAWEEKKSKTSWGVQLAIHEKVLLPRRAGAAVALITSSSCRGESKPIHAFMTVPLLSTNSRVGVPEIFNLSKGTPASAWTRSPSDCTTSLTASAASGKTATIVEFDPPCCWAVSRW